MKDKISQFITGGERAGAFASSTVVYSEMAVRSIVLNAINHNSDQYGWHPITTAPHEIEYRCLLAHDQSIVTGYWDGQGWRNERSAGLGYFPATHWQPLPPLPSVE